jgi:hypothetical protein
MCLRVLQEAGTSSVLNEEVPQCRVGTREKENPIGYAIGSLSISSQALDRVFNKATLTRRNVSQVTKKAPAHRCLLQHYSQ